MIKILFIRSEKAFLPEIDAYIEYFNKSKKFQAYDSLKIKGEYELNDFDVIWEMKGFGGIKGKDQILIHDYASLSVGLFPKLKNLLKSKINPRPHLRIFLNEDIKNAFRFNDSIDYCFRDMGIDESFLQAKNFKKEYDFVYIGSISKEREIDTLLKRFTEKNFGRLCLIGDVEYDIYNTYKDNKDIIFTGRVPYYEVAKIAAKAVCGINYIPDKYPFNIQTSTKLLEYLALDLKIITTDYKWVRHFEQKYDCYFYKLDDNHLSFDKNSMKNHISTNAFKAEDFLWEKIIDNAGIAQNLPAYFKGLKKIIKEPSLSFLYGVRISLNSSFNF